MAFTRLASLDDLKPGAMLDVELPAGEGEDRLILICNVEGQLHAMDGRCPHRGGPLGQGGLHGKMVVCPWHAWEFDCTTGQHDYNPALRQTLYTVRVEGRDVLVDI